MKIGESDLIPNLEFAKSFFFFFKKNVVYLHLVELMLFCFRHLMFFVDKSRLRVCRASERKYS